MAQKEIYFEAEYGLLEKTFWIYGIEPPHMKFNSIIKIKCKVLLQEKEPKLTLNQLAALKVQIPPKYSLFTIFSNLKSILFNLNASGKPKEHPTLISLYPCLKKWNLQNLKNIGGTILHIILHFEKQRPKQLESIDPVNNIEELQTTNWLNWRR